MTTLVSIKPALACLVSLAVVIPILLSSRRPNLREGWTLLAGVVKFALVVSMAPAVLDGFILEYTVWQVLPTLPIQFRVDGLGLLFAIVSSLLWILTSIYSIGYMRGLNEHSQTRYFAFFAIALSSTIGVAFSANLLTLYLFYEMLSLSTYPLVAHHQDGEARTGGRTYLAYLLGTSVGLLFPAMIYAYLKSGGTMDFAGGGFLDGKLTPTEGIVLTLLFVFGFAKAAVMPFHSWLPAAMVAPTPVSALLHAVAVVKVGVFCILRVFTGVMGVDFIRVDNLATVVTWFAAFTVLASSLIALSQDNLKRRLAFSTIGQLSYIVLGASVLAPKALIGSVMHIAMHAFGKITLFFCAGAILVATGKKCVSELTGIGWRMPVTMSMFFIGSLSVIGLPPTGGFVSKLYLIIGSWEADKLVVLTVFLISTLLNAAYLLPIAYQAFFCAPEKSQFERKVQEAPMCCIVPIVLTAALSVASMFCYPLFYDLANLVVKR